jgi:hypothetical protein
MIARSIGGRDVEALCLNAAGPCSGKYMVATQTCKGFAYDTAGKVDDPPNYGEEVLPIYAEQAAAKYPNGQPKYAPDGTMLDDKGNRSIFDDLCD